MVNIIVKEGKKFVGVSAFISFPYSSYYVNLMRAQPARYWHADDKCWEVPYSNLPTVLEKISDNDYKLTIATSAQKEIDNTKNIHIPDSYSFKTKPFEHQTDGIEYGLNHKKFLLADEQGCIDGDMLVSFDVCGSSFVKKLSDLYAEYKNSPTKGTYKVRCLMGDVFALNTVQDIIYSGKKPVYKLTLEDGNFINATEDHEILTTQGFIPLNQLTSESFVICEKNIPNNSFKVIDIRYIGVKDTYDIKMSDPYRNFLANHVVVHNCGKTKQMIDLAMINKQMYGYEHCLIIACVNGLKYNWQEEIGIHSDETGYILGTRTTRTGKTTIGSNQDRLYDLQHLDNIKSYFIITNIETLRYTNTEKVPCKKKGKNGVTRYKKVTRFPIVEELQKLIKKNKISMIVADEIHKCKDSTSLQGKALLSLDADSVVALTGTPLMNNAIDLYTPLKFIGVENHSLFSFKQHYCICGGFGGHQIVGYKNLPELQTMLDKCMLRRLKKDVLDLPDKIYINDFVEMNQSQYKIYNSVLEDLRQNIDRVRLSPNPLTMLIRLRQATGNPELLSTTAKGNPKFDRLLELVQEVVDNGNKAIVFSNWTDVLNPAYEMLQKHGFQPALYTGLNKDTREDEKQRFKKDVNCKVICGTIGAMGTGLTLTEATTVIFLDEPWNRAIKDQAEDRAHRIGTTASLNVITIMCKDSIDEKIHNIVYRKGKMSDIIVDKEEDLFKNPSVINYLLS